MSYDKNNVWHTGIKRPEPSPCREYNNGNPTAKQWERFVLIMRVGIAFYVILFIVLIIIKQFE